MPLEPNGSEKKRQSSKSWLEIQVPALLTSTARQVARAMKKNRAVQVWQQPTEVRGIWIRDKEGLKAVEAFQNSLPGECKSSPVMRRFTASDPKETWREPLADQVTPNLGLAPAWTGIKPGPKTIVLDAATAFGAGDHPSTRLNLRLLDACFQENFHPEPGLWLADVGAGTGILSLGMALLYAGPILALDPELASLRAVRRNLKLNPLAGPRVRFTLGFHQALAGPFGLMACNMPGAIILDALPILARSLGGGARVVFSGFRDQMAPEIIESSQKQGLLLHNEAHDQDWAGLCLIKQNL
ncbi:50S ribosomal protein L11 methyltransferase [Dethiosulfatarculus sandiegensis]|uniref:Ribosomal protein L11 methyltransferase n=1 Tax=Dethiosulfatarculus sandiegensis TaxID=1429043 RepID=A0A0D2JD34_9BACT|nr:50S ribosomal protein L11 methyltransferase [Dethiosulfatarculus sandiegensis]KIX16109.1 hypothetical protein X474_01345 [Dethiosulfatarculus sandiegensis]